MRRCAELFSTNIIQHIDLEYPFLTRHCSTKKCSTKQIDTTWMLFNLILLDTHADSNRECSCPRHFKLCINNLSNLESYCQRPVACVQTWLAGRKICERRTDAADGCGHWSGICLSSLLVTKAILDTLEVRVGLGMASVSQNWTCITRLHWEQPFIVFICYFEAASVLFSLLNFQSSMQSSMQSSNKLCQGVKVTVRTFPFMAVVRWDK